MIISNLRSLFLLLHQTFGVEMYIFLHKDVYLVPGTKGFDNSNFGHKVRQIK